MNFAEPGGTLTAGIMLGSVVAGFSNMRKRNKQRASQIRQASTLLEQYYVALDEFLSDPDAPISLQEMLLWFTDASSDHAAACILVDKLENMTYGKDMTEGLQNILREIELIRARHPTLFEKFEMCVNTGMLATLLRWDETAERFSQLIAKGASSPRREITLVATAAKIESERAYNAKDVMIHSRVAA